MRHHSEQVALALEDAIACHAYSSVYIENILQQRARPALQPGPLHLTRRADLLDLELPDADLTLYGHEHLPGAEPPENSAAPPGTTAAPAALTPSTEATP